MNPKFNGSENLPPQSPADDGKVFASKEAMLADKAANRIALRIETGKLSQFNTPLTDAEAEAALVATGLIKDGVIVSDVLNILKTSGKIIEAAKPEKKAKIKLEPEFIPIVVEKKEINFNVIQDEELYKNFEAFSQEKKKQEERDAVFNDPEELDSLHEAALVLEKTKSQENDEYYYEFAKAGLIKGGNEEVKKDLELIDHKEQKFNSVSSEGIVKNKKIATITEIALEYGVTKLDWYTNRVKITPASRFDDVRNGVDDMMEIIGEDMESKFMGLGIDVTYRGLHSEQYKEKVFKLLRSIKDGYKTKVKYFKDHSGKMRERFAVPKAILYFSFSEVKKLAYMLKNITDPNVENDYRNSAMKNELMNQIITQCNILAIFAHKYGNSIADQYDAVKESIIELGEDSEDIKKMTLIPHDDKTSRRLNELIIEFENEQYSQTITSDDFEEAA